MSWMQIFFAVWAVLLAAWVGRMVWEVVSLAQAWRRNGRWGGGA